MRATKREALAFAAAYYRRLRDLPYRDSMVQCAVDALMKGLDGPRLRELAGTDPQDLPLDALCELHRAAAREVDVVLPSAPDERAWMARVADELEDAFPGLPKRSAKERFDDDLAVIYEQLAESAATTADAPLSAFVAHLQQYRLRHFSNYQTWLDELVPLSRRACGGPIDERTKAKISGLTDLIHWASYEETTDEHAARIRTVKEV